MHQTVWIMSSHSIKAADNPVNLVWLQSTFSLVLAERLRVNSRATEHTCTSWHNDGDSKVNPRSSNVWVFLGKTQNPLINLNGTWLPLMMPVCMVVSHLLSGYTGIMLRKALGCCYRNSIYLNIIFSYPQKQIFFTIKHLWPVINLSSMLHNTSTLG